MPEVKERYYRSKYGLTDEQISILLSNQDNVKFIDEVIKKSKIEPRELQLTVCFLLFGGFQTVLHTL